MKLQQEFGFALEEVDITQDSRLFQEYQHSIPVVALKGEKFAAPKISEYRLRRALSPPA